MKKQEIKKHRLTYLLVRTTSIHAGKTTIKVNPKHADTMFFNDNSRFSEESADPKCDQRSKHCHLNKKHNIDIYNRKTLNFANWADGPN